MTWRRPRARSAAACPPRRCCSAPAVVLALSAGWPWPRAPAAGSAAMAGPARWRSRPSTCWPMPPATAWWPHDYAAAALQAALQRSGLDAPRRRPALDAGAGQRRCSVTWPTCTRDGSIRRAAAGAMRRARRGRFDPAAALQCGAGRRPPGRGGERRGAGAAAIPGAARRAGRLPQAGRPSGLAAAAAAAAGRRRQRSGRPSWSRGRTTRALACWRSAWPCWATCRRGAAAARTRYDGALVDAVRAFQQRHGLAADGVVGKATLAQLQVPPAARVRQIELALERLRWTPLLQGPRMIVINIPEFVLRAYEVRRRPHRAARADEGDRRQGAGHPHAAVRRGPCASSSSAPTGTCRRRSRAARPCRSCAATRAISSARASSSSRPTAAW